MVLVFIPFLNLGVLRFPLDSSHQIGVIKYTDMRLRLTKKTRKKLPIDDEKVPLKTKENFDQVHLPSLLKKAPILFPINLALIIIE